MEHGRGMRGMARCGAVTRLHPCPRDHGGHCNCLVVTVTMQSTRTRYKTRAVLVTGKSPSVLQLRRCLVSYAAGAPPNSSRLQASRVTCTATRLILPSSSSILASDPVVISVVDRQPSFSSAGRAGADRRPVPIRVDDAHVYPLPLPRRRGICDAAWQSTLTDPDAAV